MSVDVLDSIAVAEPATGAFARAGVLRRLARDKVAATSAILLTLIALAAIFAPWVAPYNPFDVKSLNLMDAFTPPFTTSETR